MHVTYCENVPNNILFYDLMKGVIFKKINYVWNIDLDPNEFDEK